MPEMKSNQLEMTHLLKAVDKELSAGKDKGDPTEAKLKVSLEDRDLWSKFKELTNEMIVTKSGRSVFNISVVNHFIEKCLKIHAMPCKLFSKRRSVLWILFFPVCTYTMHFIKRTGILKPIKSRSVFFNHGGPLSLTSITCLFLLKYQAAQNQIGNDNQFSLLIHPKFSY